MEDCNSVSTPASTKTLGIDKDGQKFDKIWEYAITIVMLMYLAQTPNLM